MKAIKMMCEMMVAASLVAVSACAAVEPGDTAMPSGDDTMDMGSGSGSGSGEEPLKCTTAADCGGGGMACDVYTRECVMGALTLDATDFVNDGLHWWTNTTGPEVSGTFKGPTAAVVQVKIGSAVGVVATTTGARWSLQLPAGSIAPSGTLITILMTDPSGGMVKLEQVLTLDNVAPVIERLAGALRDERGDVITYTGDAPIHDHQGATVDLSGACPTVYKYAYLMDPQAPTFGSEVTSNPLAWRFAVVDAKVESGEFRVIGPSGILKDWTSLAQVGSQVVVPLYRSGPNGIATLGTIAGNYHLDVRVRDWAQNVTTASTCWNNQPLAAPLEIKPVQISTDANALSGWTLSAGSPISRLFNLYYDVGLFEQRIVQHTAEPTVIAISSTKPIGTYERSVVNGWVTMLDGGANVACTTVDCNAPAPVAPQASSGVLSDYAITIRLYDEVSGAEVPGSFDAATVTLPARAEGAAPHAYTIRYTINQVAPLRPTNTGATFGEYSLWYTSFTGRVIVNTFRGCGVAAVNGICPRTSNIAGIEALDQAKISLPPMTTSVKTAVSASATLQTPPHVPSSTFVSPAFVWDSGNDNLPGDLY